MRRTARSAAPAARARFAARLDLALAPALAFALLVAAPARADDGPPPIPAKGDATITLLGGWHLAPQHDFYSEQERDGLEPTHSALQPGGVLSLGYAADNEFHVTIDLGYAVDSWQLNTGAANASMVTILLGADTPIVSTSIATLYGGGGLGYSLNTFTYQSQSLESNSSAGFVKLGVRFRLSRRFALVIEDRYVVSGALWPQLNSSFTVGGNLLSVGLMLHFFSPEDSGHPASNF